jgi:LPXTG-motif cell wall-anchored protein
MELPETMQPSSDEHIAGWIGVMVALSAGALWINRRRRATAGSADRG